MEYKYATWIRRVRPHQLDQYVCTACGASYAGPHATCPHCRSIMRKSFKDPLWVNETDRSTSSILGNRSFATDSR